MLSPTASAEPDLDVVVIGAGFSGLYMLHRLRSSGFSARILEQGSGVGGTWYWNRYPGARCDIESVDYCYSFSEELLHEWRWTERYASQPEILRYLEYVADRFALRPDIELETRVEAVEYDERSNRWTINTHTGQRLTARYCVMATGNLSAVKKPDLPGLDDFRGDWYHTARWPHAGVDFSGKRVGVVGTGSTGIQAIPKIAEQAAHLYVFQRTPNYSMPAHNRPLSRVELQQVLADYDERRRMAQQSDAGVPVAAPQKSALEVPPSERRAMYETGWRRGGINALSYAFTDFFTSEEANETAQEFARAKIREIVDDPVTAQKLSPRHHIGTKRTCTDTDYFATYNRDNVTLVDVRETPIGRITPAGLRTSKQEYQLDALVFAIGFDAMTGALNEIDIRGRDGLTLKQKWAAGPRTLLGLATAGFPNLFLITGPGSPSVLSNMIVSIEQHVDWVADCLEYLRRRGLDRIEATSEAENGWVDHVNDLADATLYPLATSWYLGANIPGKPRVFMPYVNGCGNYRRECERVAARDYEGFTLQRPPDMVRHDAEESVGTT